MRSVDQPPITAVNKALEAIEKWKQLRAKALELGANAALADQLCAQGQKTLDEAIDAVHAEVITTCKINDQVRANEIKAAVRVKIEGVAARMERGFSFEVRTELPANPSEEAQAQSKPIVGLSTLRFQPSVGAPILALPEWEDDADNDEGLPKKPIAKKKKAG